MTKLEAGVADSWTSFVIKNVFIVGMTKLEAGVADSWTSSVIEAKLSSCIILKSPQVNKIFK